jgi:hypothetical protein
MKVNPFYFCTFAAECREGGKMNAYIYNVIRIKNG